MRRLPQPRRPTTSSGRGSAVGLLLALGAWLGSCAPTGPPAPPLPEGLDRLDPALAEWITRGLERIEEHPRDPRTFLNLCMIYDANRLDAAAVDCYAALLLWRPDEAKAWYHRARVEHRNGQAQAARGSIRQALASFDAYVPAHVRLGEWMLESGDPAEAALAFDRALEIDPRHAGGRLGRARLMLLDGRAREAIQLLNETRRLHPDDARLTVWLAAAKSLATGELAADVPRVREPEPHPADDPWAAEVAMYRVGDPARFRVAEEMLGEGRAAEAREVLAELARADPENLQVAVQLARLDLKEGQVVEALARLEAARSRDPDQVVVHYELAAAYELQGNSTEALARIDQAVELEPHAGSVHSRRGAILRRLERYSEAIEAFTRAAELQPEQKRIPIAIGDCWTRLRGWDEAAASYERALRLDDTDPDVHARLGAVYLELGRLAEAEASLERALEHGTARPDAIERLLREVRRRRAG